MRRSFWVLLVGQAVSSLGDAFGAIAIGWLVYGLTGSKVAMGALFAASLIPEVLMLLFGGPLTDRVNRTRLMAWTDVVRTLAYAAPPLLAVTGHLSLWHLYALSIIGGAAGGLFSPSLMALLPSVVEEKQLMRANAIYNGAWQLMSLIGPGLAGVVVAFAGSHTALAIDAASFAVSGFTLFMIPAALGAARPGAARAGYLKQLAAGFRFFGRTPALLLLMLLTSIYNMCVTAVLSLFVPFVHDQLGAGPGVVGGLQSAVSVGFLACTMSLTALGDFRYRRPVLLSALVVGGACVAGLGLVGQGQAAVAIGLCVVIGLMQAAFITTSSTVFQRMVAPAIRGRVMAVRMLLVRGATPIGAFFGAVAAQVGGMPAMFLVAGLVPAVLALAAFLVPILRQLDGELAPISDAA